jgi:hypothetical protein
VYIEESERALCFFTVASSNGHNFKSAIIWAVARRTASSPLTLYACAAAPANGTFTQLYSVPTGRWPNLGGHANIVPVVANGRVYVAAYKSLMIFGPNGATMYVTNPRNRHKISIGGNLWDLHVQSFCGALLA